MSASSDENSATLYLMSPIDKEKDEIFMTLLEMEFDRSCSEDIRAIEHAKLKAKLHREEALARTLSFPLEFLGLLLFKGTRAAKARLGMQKVITRYLFKRITDDQYVYEIQAALILGSRTKD